jgi:hypothetical protein
MYMIMMSAISWQKLARDANGKQRASSEVSQSQQLTLEEEQQRVLNPDSFAQQPSTFSFFLKKSLPCRHGDQSADLSVSSRQLLSANA